MTTIAPYGSAYALVASPGLNSDQQALDDVAGAAGNAAPPTLISLSTQAQELSTFSENLVNLTHANTSFEATRGLSTTVKSSLTTAYTNAANRLTLTGIYANGQQSTTATALDTSGGATTLADILLDSYNSLGNSSGNQSGSSNSSGSNLFSIINPKASTTSSDATSLTLSPGETNTSGIDPYDREIPTKYAVAGQTTLAVLQASLKATTVNVPVAPGLVPNNSIPEVGSTIAGPPTKQNDGVATTVKTGNANSVVALDTTDPENADTRTSALNVTTGNGSNVVFIAGNNDSVVKTGTGDSFVEGEGNGIVYGGGGNDFLVANTVSGGSGNDTIFASGFAYGGSGNDFITLFSTAQETGSSASSSTSTSSSTTPTAIGGSGNDTILANVKATIVGGSGNDTIIAREGGEISSGDGKNEITAEGKADVTVGNGNNNVDLVFGGSATVGNGNNIVTANAYTDTTVGTGNNTLTLQAGGSVTYGAGGGTNQIVFGPPIASDTADAGKPNVINLNNLLYSDVTVTSEDGFVSISQNGSPSSVLNITSSPGAAPVVLQFSKNGQTQTVTFGNGATQVGPVAT